MFFLFCFKQKTAYEMRISDWSSDVFSSDLITIHYAGAFTGYGPLIAGPEGLSYFTIRSIHEEGANILPHSASQMLKGPRRGGQAGPLVPETPLQLSSAGPKIDQILLSDRDGMSVWRARFSPRETVNVRVGPDLAGVFVFVMQGKASHREQTLTPLEHVFEIGRASCRERVCQYV